MGSWEVEGKESEARGADVQRNVESWNATDAVSPCLEMV